MTQNLLDPLELDVQHLPEKGRTITFCASDVEKQKIAAAFGLLSVDLLEATLKLARWRRDGVSVRGSIKASLENACVVSLEPVRQLIDEEVDVLFVKEGSPLARPEIDANGEMILDPEGRELPEVFGGSTIRLDEVIIEALTLAIDPFPRKEGVEIPLEAMAKSDEAEAPPSPFAVLEKLKGKK